MNCKHWSDCGIAGGGACALGLYGGRPSTGVCLRCDKIEPAKKSLKAKIVNVTKAAGRAIAAKLDGQPIIQEDQEILHRRKICQGCKFNLGGECAECGCNIELKTADAAEWCPRGKWWATSQAGNFLTAEQLVAEPQVVKRLFSQHQPVLNALADYESSVGVVSCTSCAKRRKASAVMRAIVNMKVFDKLQPAFTGYNGVALDKFKIPWQAV